MKLPPRALRLGLKVSVPGAAGVMFLRQERDDRRVFLGEGPEGMQQLRLALGVGRDNCSSGLATTSAFATRPGVLSTPGAGRRRRRGLADHRAAARLRVAGKANLTNGGTASSVRVYAIR